MSSQLVQIRRPRVAPEKLAYFRYGKLGDRMIVTNDAGDWHILSKEDFDTFLAGEITNEHPQYEALAEKGFIRDALNIEKLASKVRRKKRFVGQGPHLHIVLTTLRCNQSCKYCHASRADMDKVETDMSMDTAKKVVDMAMQSTSPYINFEFQGGEPTANFPVLKFIVEYSQEKNRYEKKELDHSVVTNMTHMDEEKANWLVDNGVLVCTSLDGPEPLHNWNRAWSGQGAGNAYESVVHWMKYFNQRYIDKGMDGNLWHVDALMTTTRKTFEYARETIDLYVDLGIRNVHLRPLNPYGFALSTWKTIGYTIEEYLEFYEKTLDYIIELNKQGVQVIEGTAAVFLSKLLTPDDPNYVDILSPCGAGTGQVAYNYDGKIFTCDEARMTAAMGNATFQIGDVAGNTYQEMVQHPTVKTMALASLQDSLPSCNTCWNKPFCGVCPMHNYMTAGDLFGQRPNSDKCVEYYSISSILLNRLANDTDGSIEKIFRRWTIKRPRVVPGECAV